MDRDFNNKHKYQIREQPDKLLFDIDRESDPTTSVERALLAGIQREIALARLQQGRPHGLPESFQHRLKLVRTLAEIGLVAEDPDPAKALFYLRKLVDPDQYASDHFVVRLRKMIGNELDEGQSQDRTNFVEQQHDQYSLRRSRFGEFFQWFGKAFTRRPVRSYGGREGVYSDEDIDGDIEITPLQGATITDGEITFKLEIERVLATVRNLLLRQERSRIMAILAPLRLSTSGERRRRFEEYLNKLFNIALTGLIFGHLTLANRNLDAFKSEILIREADAVKNGYVLRLLMDATMLSILTLLASYLSKSLDIKNLFVMLTGALIGTWLSFSMRKVTLTFEELGAIEKDRLFPVVRLVYVSGLTVVIALLLQNKVVILTAGTFSTEAFLSDWWKAVMMGLLCGVSEQLLSISVGARASQLMGGLSGDARRAG